MKRRKPVTEVRGHWSICASKLPPCHITEELDNGRESAPSNIDRSEIWLLDESDGVYDISYKISKWR